MGEQELSDGAKLSICRGLLDSHLGRLFTHDEVFPKGLKHRFSYRRKKMYWRLIKPFQSFIHRKCQTCENLKRKIRILETNED